MGAEQFDGSGARRFRQHGVDHRQHGIGLRFNQLSSDAVTLGYPRAFIEQARSFREGFEIQFHCHATQRFQMFDGGGEQRWAFRAAQEFQLLGHAKTKPLARHAKGAGVVP